MFSFDAVAKDDELKFGLIKGIFVFLIVILEEVNILEDM